MNVVDRIFDLVDQRYKEQQLFAADIGVPASRISEWRRGKSASYIKRLPQIAEVLGTSVEYLLTGEKKAPAAYIGELTEEEYSLVLAYRKASEDDRAVVNAALRKYQAVDVKRKIM